MIKIPTAKYPQNTIKVLREVFQTEDGKMFASRDEAEMYLMANRMLQAIRQAQSDARFSEFGRTSDDQFARRLAEELIRQGFRFDGGRI